MEEVLDRLKRYTDGRVAVFIDAANILYSQKSMGWEVDYKKLSKFLNKNFEIAYLGFYLGVFKENTSQEKFLNILKNFGFSIVSKPIKYINTPRSKILKGNLDIEMALDMINLLAEYDVCFLFSGDSDFDVVLRQIVKNGKRCVVFSTKGHISIELMRSSSKYFDIRKFKGLWCRI